MVYEHISVTIDCVPAADLADDGTCKVSQHE